MCLLSTYTQNYPQFVVKTRFFVIPLNQSDLLDRNRKVFDFYEPQLKRTFQKISIWGLAVRRLIVRVGRIGHNSRYARSRPRLIVPRRLGTYSGLRFSTPRCSSGFYPPNSKTHCAGRENRTPVLSLARIHSTTKPYPHISISNQYQKTI